MSTHGAHGGRSFFKLVVIDDADFRIFKRSDVTRMNAARDAVKADHLTGHKEVGHLLAAVAAHHRALQKSKTDGVERVKAVAGTKERLSALDAPAIARHQFFKPLDLLQGQSRREAGFTQIAVRAR